jgi:hypothetical protein
MAERPNAIRPRRGLLAFAVALGIGLLAYPIPAAAHTPVLEPSRRASSAPVAIPGPNGSLALYGYLSVDDNVDTYSFEVSAPLGTTVGMLVPAGRGLDAFYPDAAIVAPGEHVVSMLADVRRSRPTFFEPFSMEWFAQGPQRYVTLTPGTRYVLEVGHGQGSTQVGDYVVTFTGAETMPPADTGKTVGDVARIWLGDYGNGPLRPAPLAAFTSFVACAALAIVFFRRAARY